MPPLTAPPVLAGVDFSDGALAALREARAWAERLGAPLLAMHVIEPWRVSRLAEELRSRWLERAGLDPNAVRLRSGRPWVELAREAEESGALAVVVGSHGRSGYQPVALGSTAVRLGLIAPCPILVVNARQRDGGAALRDDVRDEGRDGVRTA